MQQTTQSHEEGLSGNRRKFIRTGLLLSVSGFAGFSLLSACKGQEEGDEGQKVSPPEDLMQEHGLLNRILLIYDHCCAMLRNGKAVPAEHLHQAAGIIKSFVEDYHEKQEEQYLFPRFEKANQLTGLVATLRRQHNAGRGVTGRITQLTSSQNLSDAERQALIVQLSAFNTMYRPHEAREDTVLFPAFRKIVSKHEYDALGEEFEKNEHQLFGADGFEMVVDKVAGVEKALGIYELAQFTPGAQMRRNSLMRGGREMRFARPADFIKISCSSTHAESIADAFGSRRPHEKIRAFASARHSPNLFSERSLLDGATRFRGPLMPH